MSEGSYIFALTCCEAPYARGVGDGIAILYRVVTHAEEASAKHQNKVRQSLVIHSKTHQATSGIMRELSLMCARCKERSDGIAYCYSVAVNRVEFPFARANEGKHVMKGWLFTLYVRTY